MLPHLPWITLAIFVPVTSGLFILALGKNDCPIFTKSVSLFSALVSILVTIPLYAQFNSSTSGFQFIEKTPWIPSINVNYHLGVDGISLLFILLTVYITAVIVIASWKTTLENMPQYMASFLILSGLVVGLFAALDGMLFYIFFEATLIPMYIIIGVWGGPNRIYAAMKFFLYTLFGSLLTLIALIYLWKISGGSFSILVWQKLPLDYKEQILIFLAFFASFSIKIPMWPVHTWLPEAHVEAPACGSIMLAAILLKVGAYGFLRFSLPIAPDASYLFAHLILVLSIVAIIYISLIAIIQEDMKKLVAYSSIAHMGFVTLGFFTFSTLGVEGAIVQMISHGIISGAMFLCIGMLYDRMHSRYIADYGGVASKMPRFATLFLFFSMANSALPITSGFVGEFMVIVSAIQHNFWIGSLASTSLILGASYSLLMVKRVVFGKVTNSKVERLIDISSHEFLLLTILAISVLILGIYPKPFTDITHASVKELLQHVATSKL